MSLILHFSNLRVVVWKMVSFSCCLVYYKWMLEWTEVQGNRYFMKIGSSQINYLFMSSSSFDSTFWETFHFWRLVLTNDYSSWHVGIVRIVGLFWWTCGSMFAVYLQVIQYSCAADLKISLNYSSRQSGWGLSLLVLTSKVGISCSFYLM